MSTTSYSLISTHLPFYRRLEVIETASDEPLSDVLKTWKAYEFFQLENEAKWFRLVRGQPPCERPDGPNTEVSLITPYGFYVTFGDDAVAITHPLSIFRLTGDIRWRTCFFRALESFREMLQGDSLIFTHEGHPAVGRFYDGKPFDELLSDLPLNESEVRLIPEIAKLDEEGYEFYRGYVINPKGVNKGVRYRY